MGRVTLAPSATAHEGGSLSMVPRQSRRAKERMVFIEWRTVRNESRSLAGRSIPRDDQKERTNRADSTGPWKKKNPRVGDRGLW